MGTNLNFKSSLLVRREKIFFMCTYQLRNFVIFVLDFNSQIFKLNVLYIFNYLNSLQLFVVLMNFDKIETLTFTTIIKKSCDFFLVTIIKIAYNKNTF